MFCSRVICEFLLKLPRTTESPLRHYILHVATSNERGQQQQQQDESQSLLPRQATAAVLQPTNLRSRPLAAMPKGITAELPSYNSP